MNLLIVTIFVFIINLPFGYWRSNVNKFSLQWVLAIHLPVPLIIAARFFSHLGFEFYTFPFLIGAFFLGQLSGQFFYKRRKDMGLTPLTSCLVMDYFRGNSGK